MKAFIILFFLMLIAVNTNAATYWVDNSHENEAGGDIGTGTEQDPYNRIAIIEKLIKPGSVHTINLVETLKPYQGGFGGKGLKYWIFKNCTVIKHGNITFSSTRSIPVAALTGEVGSKTLDISPDFNQNEYRYYNDGTKIILTRPFRLGVKKDQGISFVNNKARINTKTIPVKKDLNTRTSNLSGIYETIEVKSK